MSQENGISPMYISMWFFKVKLAENSNQHINFSSLWIYMCWVKQDLGENANPQTGQGNSFSPVYILMCVFKLELSENTNPQASQENSLYVFTSRFLNWNFVKILLHIIDKNMVSL